MVVFQQACCVGAAEVGPWQGFVRGEGFLGLGFEIQIGGFESGLPVFHVETLIPEVKFGTVPPSGFDHVAQFPAATAHGGFQDTDIGIMEVEFNELEFLLTLSG